MKIKPLIYLREMISKALSDRTNVSKSFQSFFIGAMELFLTIPNRINFLQMGRFGRSSEPLYNFYKIYRTIDRGKIEQFIPVFCGNSFRFFVEAHPDFHTAWVAVVP